jgi:hypothetical protein
MTPAKPGRKWRRIGVAIGLIGLLLLIALAGTRLLWQLYWHVPGSVDFLLHRSEYEKIVRTIKEQKIAPEDPDKAVEFTGRVVWVRCADGEYTITIQTADWGHFGTAGYVYADTPPARLPDAYRTFDAPGDLPLVDQQLNLHWWTVYNNLN